MSLPALPVFTFRPNWADGLTESLVWLTDVLQSDSGAEQRRALRLSPGRQYEISLLLQKEERTFFDLSLSRLATNDWLFPLFHDIGRLADPVAIGATRLNFDTRWREFQLGGALIQGNDAFTWEAVEIISIDANGVDLAPTGTTRAWPKGAAVMPLRRGRFDLGDDTGFSKHTSRVAESRFRVSLTEPNDWTPGADGSPVYLGHPVFSLSPDVADTLDYSFARKVFTAGNDFGTSYIADASDRAFVAQAHSWFLKGRQAQAAFRDVVYRNQGRTGSFWLPTFNEDMTVSATAGSAATVLTVKNVGYGYVGGPGSGRKYIVIYAPTGPIYRKVNSVLAPTDLTHERLQLDAALGVNVPAGTRISFMDRARFDQDQFDLEHHTDSDGLTTAGAVFRTFSDTRDPSGTIYLPIPAGVKSNEPCGEFAPIEPDPCYPRPVEWYVKLLWQVPEGLGCNPAYAPTRLIGTPAARPEARPGSGNNLATTFGVPEAAYYPDGSPKFTVEADGNANFSWIITFYYPLQGGSYGCTIQYPALFCGSVGKDAHHINITMQNWDGTSGVVVEDWQIGGNFPYENSWEWIETPLKPEDL